MSVSVYKGLITLSALEYHIIILYFLQDVHGRPTYNNINMM